jgi:hypothetical protein
MTKKKPDRNAVVKELYAEFLRLPNANARIAQKIAGTKAEFARQHNVDRSILWHWEQNPEFRRLIHNDVLGVLNVDEVEKIKWTLKVKAFEGNIPAAKLLLEWAGLYDEELQKILAAEDAEELADGSEIEDEDGDD